MNRPYPVLNETRRMIDALGRSSGPIVLGPWLGEIGFELLYWIPFLRWVIHEGRLDPARLWVISRGGCASWYADLTPNYLDAFDWFSPEECAQQAVNRTMAHQATARRRTAKQSEVSAFDRSILARAATVAPVAGAALIHPWMLYALFRPYWQRKSDDPYTACTRVRALSRLPVPDGLPAHYVAVKFYSSQACLDRPAAVRQVQRLVRLLTKQTDVVLLHTGTAFDEHGEFALENHPRLHRRVFTPRTNLDEQSAILGGASGFVGTYGGFAYLAPFLGVRTLACYTRANFRQDHLTLMTHLAATRLSVRFVAHPLGECVAIEGRHAA